MASCTQPDCVGHAITRGLCDRCRKRAERARFPDRNQLVCSRWREKNPAYEAARYDSDPEHHRRRYNRWVAQNRGHVNAKKAARKNALLQRTPEWADLIAIEQVYERASSIQAVLGVRTSVDHIIPPQGELVSGLHVHNNLQVLTLSANSAKKNRYKVA